MKPSKPSKKLILAVIGLLLALLILKAVLLLMTKPKITVNYVAEYNKISRPENYDPNENAAPYYQEAFGALVKMPDELHSLYNNWPTDYLDFEQTMLESWVASNSQAFEYFREAVNKPYYWLERQADKDNNMMCMMFPELSSLRHLTDSLLWNAKLEASKGRLQTAFKNIIDCYRAGRQKCSATLCLIDQHVGLHTKQNAVHNALIILDRTKTESEALKTFQNSLQSELDNDTYIPSVQTEKYFLYDEVQRHFIDNGKGNGRLAFSAGLKYITLGDMWPNLKQRLYYCFAGPTKNEILEQIKQLIVVSDQIMTKTPWQIKKESSDYLKEMRNIEGSRDILEQIKGSTESIFHNYYKTRSQTEALVAVLAILRFKADNNRLPVSLDELVSTGYLQSIPMDPFSDGPLVYKLTEDNFKLYSIGEDFVDDGGSNEVKTDQESILRWKYVDTPDIVYWPFRDLNKLRYELNIKNNEVGVRKEIEEANQPK